MKLSIDSIIVPERIRQDPGDLTELKNSIMEVGLLNPIIITENYELVSGFRRLMACKELRWSEIEVKIVELGENQVQQLDLEYHENIGRSDLSEAEKEKYHVTRELLLNPPRTSRGICKFFKTIWSKIKGFFKRRRNQEDNYWD